MMETTAATAANDDNAPTLFNEDALVVLLLLLGGLLLGVPSPSSVTSRSDRRRGLYLFKQWVGMGVCAIERLSVKMKMTEDKSSDQ